MSSTLQSHETLLFAGAKETATLEGYRESLQIPHLELLIDWGWFYFITKPMFKLIDFFFHLFEHVSTIQYCDNFYVSLNQPMEES